MAKSGDGRRVIEILGETMKDLMPPRVELTRRQHELLQKLSGRTGKPLKVLVQQAVDRFLEGEGLK
jgi:hypothetical protein